MPTDGTSSADRASAPPGAPLPDGAFDGRAAFQATLQVALAAAARENWGEMIFSDIDFADWSLGTRASVEALQAWAATGRRLQLIARDFNVIAHEHARFVRWRQAWDHIVVCRVCAGPSAPAVPSAIWTPGWSLQRIDPDRCRGVCGSAPESRVALRQLLDECLRQGRPGFAASVLGL